MSQKIEFSRDGLTIRGHVRGVRNRPQPAVILSHGFLANERMCRKYAKLLAGLGYLTVTFDFCGGGIICHSDGRSRDMTVLTEKEDLRAVVEGVKEKFSPTGITLMGCSQGGFVSGLLAAELGAEAIEKLILFYPAICIPDDARGGKMMFYRFDPDNIPETLGRFPMELGRNYATTVFTMDPYRELKPYTGPVLLVHGTADPVVDIGYSQRLSRVYANCRYEEIDGGGHVFKGNADQQACQILREYMGG